ncbi:MAG: single-stranded DNA-binding protein, partial [Candidatus Omnitrophica bacterium]|nr:single-stranded DNA-binding protein [Candidatus Omnitrophota bacterium]
NRRFKDKNGEQKEEVCFITAVVWDKQAETCNQYLKKGSPLFVEGRLQSRSWEDAAGQKRNVIEVRAERVQFLSSAPRSAAPAVDAAAQSQELPATIDQSSETEWLGESEDKSNGI